MNDFIDFIALINQQLRTKEIYRLESILMPANFSSIVGEFMVTSIARHCPTLVKNQYHNGHPDLIPAGRFPGDAVQHSGQGIEVKASRYLKGWQPRMALPWVLRRFRAVVAQNSYLPGQILVSRRPEILACHGIGQSE